MNTIGEGCLVAAQGELDAAMQALENHAHDGPPSLVGDAYRHLLVVRGQLAALKQLHELQALQHAPTERPVRLVR